MYNRKGHQSEPYHQLYFEVEQSSAGGCYGVYDVSGRAPKL